MNIFIGILVGALAAFITKYLVVAFGGHRYFNV
jgi:hypothetical protein